jgi:hypothetical protein
MTLDNYDAGEATPGLWPIDGNGLFAMEVIEAAGLGAGEPRLEAVQALSAPGVADYISKHNTTDYAKLSKVRPDLRHILSVPGYHISSNLLRWQFASPNSEVELAFTCLYIPSMLSLSPNRLQFVWFNVLFYVPLA